MRDNRSYSKDHLKYLVAALVIMVLLEKAFWGGPPSPVEAARTEKRHEPAVLTQKAPEPAEEQEALLAKLEPTIGFPEEAYSSSDSDKGAFGPYEAYGPYAREQARKEDLPQWRRNAVTAPDAKGKPRIVVVIDDLGVSRGYSKEVLGLPGPLTLSFLPYAQDLAPLVEEGRANGHEIMVHMPMEPMNDTLDMGTIFLSAEETPAEFSAMLDKGLAAFSGYVGLNNHMGSKLTQDKPAMKRLMAELRRRGLLFLDSRTISGSVGAETAAEYGVPYASRDVFLDDDPSAASVHDSLAKTERIAREYGQAIAIGHPKPDTIAALKEWLPTLAEKGFVLVPVSAVVSTRPSAVAAAHDAAPAPPHQQ